MEAESLWQWEAGVLLDGPSGLTSSRWSYREADGGPSSKIRDMNARLCDHAALHSKLSPYKLPHDLALERVDSNALGFCGAFSLSL